MFTDVTKEARITFTHSLGDHHLDNIVEGNAGNLVELEEQQLVALGESQLEDMRGGYLGFYFAITFRGYWDTQGNKWADVDYEAGFDGDTQSGQVTSVPPYGTH